MSQFTAAKQPKGRNNPKVMNGQPHRGAATLWLSFGQETEGSTDTGMPLTTVCQVKAEDTPGHTLYDFIAVKCPRIAKSVERQNID